MNVLVFDAGGYLARRAARALAQAGHAPTIVVPRIPPGSPTRLEAAAVVSSENGEQFFRAVRSAAAAICLQPLPVPEWEARDLSESERLAEVARGAGLGRIVYLGPMLCGDARLDRISTRVTDALRRSGAALSWFRVGPVIASGSPDMQVIRGLAERVPLLPCGPWLRTQVRPVSAEDIFQYLSAALQRPPAAVECEIAGASTETYSSMIRAYAALRGLRRAFVRVPGEFPQAWSLLLRALCPLAPGLARSLVRFHARDCLADGAGARRLFPEVQPADFHAALRGELDGAGLPPVRSALRPALDQPRHRILRRNGFIVGIWETAVNAPAAFVFPLVERIGGANGWYFAEPLWQMRGLIDEAVGGPGMRRPRRDPQRLLPNDVLDCWRVEKIDPGRLLLLRAEMKVPGRAWLQFECIPREGDTLLRMLVYFDPRGLSGEAYWYALYPFHVIIFDGMHREIAAAVRRMSSGAVPRSSSAASGGNF